MCHPVPVMTVSTLIVLAAGRSSRFGRSKVLEPVGPNGQCLLDLTLSEAARAGLERAVVVCRADHVAELEPHLAAASLSGCLVPQRLDDLPARPRGQATAHPGGPSRSAGPNGRRADRTRPWGTGHAVLAARHEIDGPFSVANADDFYGPEAWQALGAQLPRCTARQGVIVSFPAERTLSPAGGVSRGWVQEAGHAAGSPADPAAPDPAHRSTATGTIGSAPTLRAVAGLVELLELQRAPTPDEPTVADGAVTGHARPPAALVGIDPAGQRRYIAPNTPVSMNLWALSADVMPALEGAFEAWLDAGPGPDDEFALSTALDGLLRAGWLRLEHVPAGRLWAGLTHPDDRYRVQALLFDAGAAATADPASPPSNPRNGVSR